MKQNKNLSKFFIKCALISLPFVIYFSLVIYTDIFNVFHPHSIRQTSAAPARQFLKMKYLVANPKQYNAFIFGSSRVGFMPTDYLNNNSDLSWSHMTYYSGILEEHLDNLHTLIESGVTIKKIIIGIDNIPLYITMEDHDNDLMRTSYSKYVRQGWRFYLPYLYQFNINIFRQVLEGKKQTEHFYKNGGLIEDDLTEDENEDHKSYREDPFKVPFETVINQIQETKDFCKHNGIEVLFVTNPLWKRTYLDACSFGYLDFLRQVADVTPFINFSCLNETTCNGRNYFDGSHYKPNIGLLMLRIILDEDFEERESLASSQFGIWVTSDNVDSVISSLQTQLDSFSLGI